MDRDPEVIIAKYPRKRETGPDTVADLDRRYPQWRHSLLETIVRPTGFTHVIREQHRTDNLPHFAGCYPCRVTGRQPG
jgi:hypothetical protein